VLLATGFHKTPVISMARKNLPLLSRRERQIMDIIYERGQATAGDVQAAMHDAPSYSTVRTLLRVLTDKGHVQHHADGARYVYSPTVSPGRAKRSALQRIVSTFFAGSAEAALVTLFDMHSARLSAEELARLESLSQAAREKEAGGECASREK
jgi:BlaI family penicillinase repressor